MSEPRREHSFENHIEDDVIELINAGRAVIAAALSGRPDTDTVVRFETAAKGAALELAMRGRDIKPKLDIASYALRQKGEA